MSCCWLFVSEAWFPRSPAVTRLIVYCWLHIPKQVWLAGSLAGTNVWETNLRLARARDCVVRFRWRVACCLIIIDSWISTHEQVWVCTRHAKTLASEHLLIELKKLMFQDFQVFIRRIFGIFSPPPFPNFQTNAIQCFEIYKNKMFENVLIIDRFLKLIWYIQIHK